MMSMGGPCVVFINVGFKKYCPQRASNSSPNSLLCYETFSYDVQAFKYEKSIRA